MSRHCEASAVIVQAGLGTASAGNKPWHVHVVLGPYGAGFAGIKDAKNYRVMDKSFYQDFKQKDC